MPRGQKQLTPTDPVEARKYKARREANNASAMNHRFRKNQELAEGKLAKEECARLKAALSQANQHVKQLKSENHRLLEYVITHDCVSTTAYREQLFKTFGQSNQAPRYAQPSVPITFNPDAGRFVSVAHCPQIPSYHAHAHTIHPPQQGIRPADFWLTHFPPRDSAASSSVAGSSQGNLQPHDNQKPQCKEFVKKLLKSGTGYTPLPEEVTALHSNLLSTMNTSTTAPLPVSNLHETSSGSRNHHRDTVVSPRASLEEDFNQIDLSPSSSESSFEPSPVPSNLLAARTGLKPTSRLNSPTLTQIYFENQGKNAGALLEIPMDVFGENPYGDENLSFM